MSRSDRHLKWSPFGSRLLALPFVALCTVVYLGSAVHFALVQHATCPEHGEVIHVGEAEAHAQPPRLEEAFSDERITQTSQQATPAHGAEAHCSHALLRREGLTTAAWYLIGAEPEAQSSPAFPLEQLHPEPVARLRLAPKSSPPLS